MMGWYSKDFLETADVPPKNKRWSWTGQVYGSGEHTHSWETQRRRVYRYIWKSETSVNSGKNWWDKYGVYSSLLSRSLCLSDRVLPPDALTLNIWKRNCSKSTGEVTNVHLTMTEGAGTRWQWILIASTGTVRKTWGKRKPKKKKKACRLRQCQDFWSVNKKNWKTTNKMRIQIRISHGPISYGLFCSLYAAFWFFFKFRYLKSDILHVSQIGCQLKDFSIGRK